MLHKHTGTHPRMPKIAFGLVLFNGYKQCFGSGLEPDSISSVDLDPDSKPDPGGSKMTHKNRKKL
jgi:hypothetical protein